MTEKIIKSAIQALIFGGVITAVQFLGGSADIQTVAVYFVKITAIYFGISVVFDLLFKRNR